MQSPVPEKVKRIVKALVAKRLGAFDAMVSEIKSSADWMGEEILEIHVSFDAHIDLLLVKETNKLRLETFDALDEIGEERYPLYKYHFLPDQSFKAA